jgi:hypothetical protein
MSPTEHLAQLQERLARAVAAGAFEEAGRLLEPYFAQTGQALRELPPADGGALASRVLEFYRWAISLARANRAQTCAQLRELPPASPYRSLPGKSRRHWQYDA